MSTSELKNKVLKVAQAYKTEKLRNNEFDEAIKKALKDVDGIKDQERDLDLKQKEHQHKGLRLQALQKETAKEKMFQETVKKQEQVIARLESLLENSVESKERARDNNMEIEQLNSEVANLMKKVKDASYGPNLENSEVERLR